MNLHKKRGSHAGRVVWPCGDIAKYGIWNLVLPCRSCNRGETVKLAGVPRPKYLEWLHKRNSFLIDNHHLLRDTLMGQSGMTDAARRQFLQEQYSWAKSLLIHDSEPAEELETAF
jgi:hypothetical protein